MVKNKPKVAIITPSFNRSKYISETIDSVLNQTYDNWEQIIVDDGSTDNSIEIINDYIKKDDRIKLFSRERGPKGACTCRNIAIEKSDADYLIFLDTDDILEPFCIKQRIDAMSDNLDFAIFPSLLFEEKIHDLNLWWNIDNNVSELQRQFHQDSICQGTGILIKKTAFEKMGLWDEELLIWQDIELFFRAYIQDYKYAKFFNLPPDLHIRRLISSISRSDFYNFDKTKSRESVIKKTAKLLIENNKAEYLKELIYMTVEVVYGFFAIKKFKDGKLFINWAFKNSILSKKDKFLLEMIKLNIVLHLKKFKIGLIIEKKIMNKYYVNSNIGKIKYK